MLSVTMLTDPQTKSLREALVADRTRLIESAHKAVEFSMDRDRDRIGRDSMDESMEEIMIGTELRLADREKFLLGKIDSALDRLAKGVIDECDDCGQPIGFARLKARPVTTQCIACKEESESAEPAS
jgi:DnaK suppressor protein